MILKGVISNKSENRAEAFLPEENNSVTAMLPFAKNISVADVNIGDNCVVALFDSDTVNLANGVILAIY